MTAPQDSPAEQETSPRPSYQFRTTVISASCWSLVWFGDAVIYIVLPLYAGVFGFSVYEVGALLTMNRVIRIVGYGWVSPISRRFGTNIVTAVACGAGALTTIVYGLTSSFVVFMIARLVWGASWGMLNLITTAYAYGDGVGAGKRVGASRAISIVGPFLAVSFVGILCIEVGPRQMFVLYGLIGLLAVPLAFLLPAIRNTRVEGATQRRLIPTPLNMLVFVIAFGADGVFGTTLSLSLADFMPVSSAIIGAGLLLAFQRFANIVLALTSGPLVDRIGAQRLLPPACVGIVAGLLVVALGHVYIGAITIITSRALLGTAVPLIAAQRSPDRIAALASYATWNDIGLAFGSFLGAICIAWLGHSMTYSGFAVLIALMAITYVVRSRMA